MIFFCPLQNAQAPFGSMVLLHLLGHISCRVVHEAQLSLAINVILRQAPTSSSSPVASCVGAGSPAADSTAAGGQQGDPLPKTQ